MKRAAEWRNALVATPLPPDLERMEARGGDATLKFRGVFLHSRYNPREETTRLVDSAGLDPTRPVLLIGLGLGYGVLELQARGFEVAALEPEPAVARFALEGPLRDVDLLLGVGDADAVADTDAFRAFAQRTPQPLVHPATARLHPGYAERVQGCLSRAALSGQRLSVAIVGPLYGGSLPIASYLDRAFRRLGHRTLFVDNAPAYALYRQFSEGIRTRKAVGQLNALLLNLLSQYAYARVAEFAPEICIVIAQAPVGPEFPARLAQDGILSAYWYVENWRHLAYWKDVAPFYDAFFHIQPGEFETMLEGVGCRNHAFVQTGCDPEIHRPVTLTDEERKTLGCAASFAGAGYYNRNQLFAGLTDFDLKIWGVDWSARELQPFIQNEERRFTPEDFAKIAAASTINLNLHSSLSRPGVDPDADAINPRVFEIAACGGFQLCDPCKGLERLFDFETELPVYRDLVELRAKLRHYLDHPEERAAIATRARERALREHTYDRRAQAMLDFLFERHGARLLGKGVRAQRSMSEVADRVGRDTPLGAWLAALPAEELFVIDNVAQHLPPVCSERTETQATFAFLAELHRYTGDLIARRGL